MNLPPCLKLQDGLVMLSVKAQPRASRSEVSGLLGTELKVKVAAPPVDGAANEALVEFLSDTLKVPRRSVQLVRGASATHKVFSISGTTAEQVAQRLGLAKV